MPSPRRRNLRAHAALTPFWREYLLTGHEWAFLDGSPLCMSTPTLTEDAARDAWEQYGAELTDDFVTRAPFWRFWGFWKFATTDGRPRDEKKWLLNNPEFLTEYERELLAGVAQ